MPETMANSLVAMPWYAQWMQNDVEFVRAGLGPNMCSTRYGRTLAIASATAPAVQDKGPGVSQTEGVDQGNILHQQSL